MIVDEAHVGIPEEGMRMKALEARFEADHTRIHSHSLQSHRGMTFRATSVRRPDVSPATPWLHESLRRITIADRHAFDTTAWNVLEAVLDHDTLAEQALNAKQDLSLLVVFDLATSDGSRNGMLWRGWRV